MSENETLTPEVKPITQSIFLTVKKMLGIAEEYHAFDLDLLVNINSVFLTLNQLGVGPKKPYRISGVTQTWSDFLGEQEEFLDGVQTYVYLKTRLLFDPPTNSFLVNAIQDQAKEFEWRFTVQPKNEDELNYIESFNEFKKETAPVEEPEPEEPEPTDQSEDVEKGGSDETNLEPTVMRVAKRPTKTPSLYDIFS